MPALLGIKHNTVKYGKGYILSPKHVSCAGAHLSRNFSVLAALSLKLVLIVLIVCYCENITCIAFLFENKVIFMYMEGLKVYALSSKILSPFDLRG